MRISVVLCTYNRSSALVKALDSMKRMAAPQGFEWELIVVNNNSTDDTAAVVQEFSRESGLNVRYAFEGRQGKSCALNRGIDAAAGDILAFTDDDIAVSPDWLNVIHKEFSRDPALDVISGRVELLNPADLPITTRSLANRAESKTPSDIFGLMVGCNFATRRRVAESVGQFDSEFGPGRRWKSHEDGDFLYRCAQAGLKLVYVPEMLVHHDHGRRGAEAEQQILRAYAIGAGAFYAKHTLLGDRLAPRIMYWRLLWVFRHRGFIAGIRQFVWVVGAFVHYAVLHWTSVFSTKKNRAPGVA